MNDIQIGQKQMDSPTQSEQPSLIRGYNPPPVYKSIQSPDPFEKARSMTNRYAEGDITSDQKGTTARANAGKPKWNLLPIHLLEGVVRVLEKGAIKYAPWNWTKGSPWSTPFNSAWRHLVKFYWTGEDIDPETGESHIDHAICNLLFLKHYITNYKEGDDRPGKIFGTTK